MIKLGSVPFINAKPLVYPLASGLVDHDFEISYFNPSLLSDKLKQHEVDIGLIPVAEMLRMNSYKVIPDISISSNGKVDSVALVMKKEKSLIKTVAVDNRSQSSTALLRVILEIFYGLSPQYIKREYNDSFFEGVDAGMVIGDSGLRLFYENPADPMILDLGEIWTAETGLPFVYAVFALNRDVDLGRNMSSLLNSKRAGMDIIDEICESLSGNLGVGKEFCINYLKNRINYDLDKSCIEGLIRYSEYLSELGYCNKIDNLNFYT